MKINKNRKKKRLQLKFTALGCLLLAVAIMAEGHVRPIIQAVTGSYAKTYATSAVNDAVTNVLEVKGLKYENLIKLTYNEAGAVQALETDMVNINLLQSDITTELVNAVVDFTSQPVEIPVGNLFGSQFLSGRGPMVEVKLIPAGYVETDVINRFESAGINQVRHSIVMTVRISLTAVIPGYRVDATVEQEIILAETVIVGAVPEAFTLVGDGTEPMVGLIQDYGADKTISR